jgi:RNA polymerase sigma-70 factor (ECF subfamily)
MELMETDDRSELDRRLARGAKDGDRSAVDALYRSHYPDLLRLCRYMLRIDSEAEDAAQEIFLRIFQGLVKDDGDRPFRPWLYSVARNVIVDLLRRSGRWREIEDDLRHLAPNYATEAVEPLLRLESAARLRKALGRLPEAYRLTLFFTAWLDLTPSEIAEILGQPSARVRIHLFRALKLLEEELREP